MSRDPACLLCLTCVRACVLKVRKASTKLKKEKHVKIKACKTRIKMSARKKIWHLRHGKKMKACKARKKWEYVGHVKKWRHVRHIKRGGHIKGKGTWARRCVVHESAQGMWFSTLFMLVLQSRKKYFRKPLVFMWNSALLENFNFDF